MASSRLSGREASSAIDSCQLSLTSVCGVIPRTEVRNGSLLRSAAISSRPTLLLGSLTFTVADGDDPIAPPRRRGRPQLATFDLVSHSLAFSLRSRVFARKNARGLLA